LLIFQGIEKIEIAFRTRLVYLYAIRKEDAHWYTRADLFTPATIKKCTYEEVYKEICKEMARSKEEFLIHYKNRYKEPALPPSWMALETVSFGVLSLLYQFLKKDSVKKEIAESFGLYNTAIMENWLHAISTLRNLCAHHNRIWNRRFFLRIQIPYNTRYPFLEGQTIKDIWNNKLFAYLCCIKYLLDRIKPQHQFTTKLVKLINSGGSLLSIKDMGFPEHWQELAIWEEH
jgi:abortive infection bacteriophage resistance protein